MTKQSSNLDNLPFLLKPAAKDYLWGGNRLNEDFSKNIALSPLAETWECSTHPDGPSTVASGLFEGMSLRTLLQEKSEFLGVRHREKRELPILIKFIDAKRDLSVQVHPDDSYAKKNENGQLGKTEMWYVMDAEADSKLVFGLHHSLDQDTFRKSAENGSIEKYLQRIPIHKGDLFFIEPGTIHAIGAGALIAEVQESSNLTYRIYDYNRVDKDGKKRVLHLEKAIKVANLNAAEEPRQPLRVLRYRRGCASELLCRCRYFQTERLLINTAQWREMANIQTDRLSFQVLLCMEGCGTLFCENEALSFIRGDCIFVPADSPIIHIHGNAQMLKVIC